MEKQNSEISQQELIIKILHMHDDMGMGFRKVSRELTSQGYKFNKDSVNRLYNKYKLNPPGNPGEDKELTQLKQAETRQLERLGLRKEKAEIRKRRNALFVEERTMSFEQRKQLFINQEKLLRFAKRVMPIVDPMLWDEFSEFCWERDYDLANATAIALGSMKDFESQPTFSGIRKFDEYLRRGISEYLAGL